MHLLPHLLLLLTTLSPLASSLPKTPCDDDLHTCDYPASLDKGYNLTNGYQDHKPSFEQPLPPPSLPKLNIFPRGGGGGPIKNRKKKPEPPIQWNATWDCWYNNKPLWSNYQLRGKNWNVTEKRFKKAITDAGVATNFYFAKFEEGGVEKIHASWRHPLGCKKKVSQYLSPVIGITPKNRENHTELVPIECRKQ